MAIIRKLEVADYFHWFVLACNSECFWLELSVAVSEAGIT